MSNGLVLGQLLTFILLRNKQKYNIMHLKPVLLSVAVASALAASAQKAPEPYGPTPNDRQKEWFDREIIAFFHYGINTYEDFVNEGEGKAPTAIFNPTALDCGQWIRTLKEAGIPAGI